MSQSSTEQAPLLAGKVALVAGASRGIGAAAARAFAEAGAAVILAARDAAALEAVALEIREAGGRAVAVRADVGEPGDVERLVQAAVDNFGRLDVAFNNATDGPPPAPLAEVDVEGFDRALRGNARTTFLGMKYQIQAMLRTGGAAIVNMASLAGLNGVANLAGYVAGKAAIIALTKVAALDYADRGIRVNVVAPGAILTHHLKAAGDEAQRQAAQAAPMRRVGQAHEVAAAVVWLCSDRASYITGVILPIDGGQSAGIKPLQFYRQGKPMPPQTEDSHEQVRS
jgi:NAD(P)-dependent dehydrogenase (short-subunit alcohol dehydrogenase family)